MPNKSLCRTYEFIQAPPRLEGARNNRQEKRERFAIHIGDFKDADVGLINRQIVPFLEGDAVEFRRGVEDAIEQDVVQFEVGIDLRFVEGVTRLANFLGIKRPVPRGDWNPPFS